MTHKLVKAEPVALAAPPYPDARQPAIVEPDFIAYAEQPTTHDGKAYWLRQCFELIEGRWEGFVSMRDRTT